ncbi:acetyltransferase [Shinella fusca]|uniref:Sugar O-acyltransferase (Sialic acid O-acetyltransferase NeuD family) n=1 Tax=Shinella fusca TaxID=544480 RepID=A0A7W7YZY3_9HYPH|nr:acetyltransferase [Shinella fusca]MBB5045192.1 sugar O-acyltransferase (sialic acid O-acetyltransferase NeuD family) [Shinella fusca]
MTGVLAIAGAGGHGRVIADAALECGWHEVVFFDDRFPHLVSTLEWPVLGTFADFLGNVSRFKGVAVGIGDGRARLSILDRLAERDAPVITIVHPHAWVSSRAKLGAGCMISAGAIINVGAQIGRGAIVNTGATVDHDCRVGPGVHVAPGAHISGSVEIGANSWIGVGASIRQGICIGSGVIVGAGAAVVSDLPDDVVAVGVPARVRN